NTRQMRSLTNPSHVLSPTSHDVYSFLPFFFFNETAPTEISTLSLHDALPISKIQPNEYHHHDGLWDSTPHAPIFCRVGRSEEHTSELQSLAYLVCRVLRA